MKTQLSILGLIMVIMSNSLLLQAQENKMLPDISDLKMTEEIRDIYLERQESLLNQIDEGMIVINSSYGFEGGRHIAKVAPNFLYLTGISEAGNMLVLSKEKGYSLFRPGVGQFTRRFHGSTPDPAKLKKVFGIDEIYSKSQLKDLLEKNIEQGIPIHIDFKDEDMKAKLSDLLEEGNADQEIMQNIGPLIYEMRVHKDDLEIKFMQKAIDITHQALLDVLASCEPGMFEFEIEALIEYNFLKYGSSIPAFSLIVGSGINATILHYEANNRLMEDGELLLMDIGAEYGGYAADISRTIPVNGSFTKEQKEIYALILKAQKAAIKEMKPGNTLIDPHQKANEVIMAGLQDLGLVTDPESEWQTNFYSWYPAIHYLGLNVHDVGEYISGDFDPQNMDFSTMPFRLYEKGMVTTIEPGIYLRAGELDHLYDMYEDETIREEIKVFIEAVGPAYEKYKNIGVRIEDDVLITADGNQVLSQEIPEEIVDIEDLMK